MAKKKLKRSDADLGKVLQTFGGRSMASLLAVGGAIAAVGIVAFGVALFVKDYREAAIATGCLILLIALGYVGTNLTAVGTKVEVCKGGVRVLRWRGMTELPWDQIVKIEVGKVRLEHKLRWNVIIHPADGDAVELLHGFWDAAGGAMQFAKAAQAHVDDVEYL